MKESYFLEDFLELEEELLDFSERILSSLLLILAALFLWMTFFFTALSVRDMAFLTAFFVFSFLALRIAASMFERIRSLTPSFLFEARRALLAVFVTGMICLGV